MSIRKRFLLTGFVVFIITLCIVPAVFASPGPGVCGGQAGPVLAGSGGSGLLDSIDCGSFAPNIPASIKDLFRGQKVPSGNIQFKGAVSAGSCGIYPVLGATSVSLSSEESQMLSLVNKERAAAGLGSLTADASLVKLARLKAQDMVDRGYFDHNSPTYGSPFDMMKSYGISYSYAGENLAMAPSVTSAHNALMQSPGHRANILGKNYDRVGIGIVVSGGYRYCVQMFTGGQRDSGSAGTVEQPGRNNQPRQPSTGNGDVSSDESLMVSLINRERAGAGLAALTQDALLSRLAGLKARDFIDNNYFSHTSPTYGTYKSMLTSYGVKYVNAGENLAVSYSVTSAHAALMKSSGNKANILSPKYSRVGVGIAVKGNYMYIVEMFTDGGTGSGTGSGTGGGSNGGSTGGTTGGTTTPPTGSGGQTGSGDTGTAAGLTADEQRMLSLVNAERAAGGLQPLKANLKLTEVARLKAKDMISKNYFDHTSPTYGSPFDMMRQFGITYRTAGENLAGAPSVDIAHTSLMNSPGHRANIMNSSFREVGIGIVDGGPYGKMFVQMFIG